MVELNRSGDNSGSNNVRGQAGFAKETKGWTRFQIALLTQFSFYLLSNNKSLPYFTSDPCR